MRLLFDHGTLVLADAPDLSRKEVPGLLWDRRVALYRAPAYRHAEVVEALAALQLPLVDAVLPRRGPSSGTWTLPELRPYQQAALVAWDIAEGRGVIALPTGSGKTRVAAAALAQTGAPALCLVPTRALLNQWLKELAAFYSGPIGCLGDGRQQLEDLTVATFESAYRWMPRIGNRFNVLIVDEAHHFGYGVRDEALEMCVASRRLGLSATPPDGAQLQRLTQLVGPVVYQLGLADLAGKWLADFEVVVLRVGLSREERERYAIAREHLIMPLTCEIGRRERERVLLAFRDGALRALVSSRVLNEGIDVPDAEVAIIVGSTLGQREHVQRIGRLLRPAPGKRAIVYELVTLDTSEAWRAVERRRGLGRQTAASA